MNKFGEYCIRVLSNVRPNATFLSIRNYRNNHSEVSNFSVVFHANYLNAVRKAQNIIKSASYPGSDNFSEQDLNRAKNELLESFENTLSGFNPLYTCHDVYENILGADGKSLPGVKLHVEQSIVHINALKIRKKIITPGIYTRTNSAPKTIAKRYLRSLTPLCNWVQFKLQPKRFDKLVVEGMTIKGS